MIAIDSSALIAILRGEARSELLLEAIAGAKSGVFSSVSYLETSMVLAGPAAAEDVWRPLDAFLLRARIEIVDFDREQTQAARNAFTRFGKGRHPAALNFGDCAAYALAKSRNVPLLFKGEDFCKTDIIPVL